MITVRSFTGTYRVKKQSLKKICVICQEACTAEEWIATASDKEDFVCAIIVDSGFCLSR